MRAWHAGAPEAPGALGAGGAPGKRDIVWHSDVPGFKGHATQRPDSSLGLALASCSEPPRSPNNNLVGSLSAHREYKAAAHELVERRV
eukprot:9407337-Pyramimonas_sp.AAC.1